MLVYIQWALNTPTDWFSIDPNLNPDAWANLPKRPRPTGTQNPGNTQGWINAINCQGVEFEYDVYVVEGTTIDGEEAAVLTGWYDQSEPIGNRQAHVWTFLPLAPDPEHGGQMNTRQSVVRYLEPTAYAAKMAAGLAANEQVFTWAEFEALAPARYPEAMRRYGVLLSNQRYLAHRSARAFHGWEDW